MTRFAFAGFQHGHILGLVRSIRARPDAEIVAAAEADPDVRRTVEQKHGVCFTHEDPGVMIDETECDTIAIGAAYADRGALAIRALERGRHVMSDKPLCTRLSEWEQIRDLAAGNQLAVGCQLSMRYAPELRRIRDAIAGGAIGDVQTVTFSGQHPLLWGSRPAWYFQEGRHGGTINDIAVHGLDAVEWMTGRRLVEVVSARTWNAKTPTAPFFQTGAQMMLRLDNQGGVLGDVSYFGPDRLGYRVPSYWRFTIHGTAGMIERNGKAAGAFLARDTDEEPVPISTEPMETPGYLDDFLACVRGEPPRGGLDTAAVLRAARLALITQQAADEGRCGMCIP